MFTLNTLGREVVIIIFSFDLYKLSQRNTQGEDSEPD